MYFPNTHELYMPGGYSSEYCEIIPEYQLLVHREVSNHIVLSLAADSSTKTSISEDHLSKPIYHQPLSISFRCAAIGWVTFCVNVTSLIVREIVVSETRS